MNKTFLILSVLLLLSACVTPSKNNSGNSDVYNETELAARARAHTDLGAAYLQQGKFEIALSEFNESAQIDPSYAPAYNGLGLVYAALGEDAKAEVRIFIEQMPFGRTVVEMRADEGFVFQRVLDERADFAASGGTGLSFECVVTRFRELLERLGHRILREDV